MNACLILDVSVTFSSPSLFSGHTSPSTSNPFVPLTGDPHEQCGTSDSAFAHTILVSVFTASRYLHTLCYALAIALMRTLAWMVCVLTILGMAINAITASFDP